ncbi:MAG: hypothetical protein V4537_05005 [Pseudomonadota bacterium]
MRSFMIVGVFGVVLSISGAGTAQNGPGKIAPERGTMGGAATFRPDLDTRQSYFAYNQMLDYAKCTSGLGNKLVVEALAQQPFSAAEQAQFLQLDVRLRSCKRAGLTNIHSLRRGSLAEGLYHKAKVDPGTLPPLSKDAPQYAAFMRPEATYNSLRDGPDQPMIAATNCLAAEQPVLADAVLATKHGTDAEAATMDKLFAAAPDCAGATRPSHISRSFLRAFLADSLRRYALFSTKASG